MRRPFLRIASPASQVSLAEWDNNKVDLQSVQCPINEMHGHAGKRLTDLSVILANGAVGDFVWTWYSECLIQDRTLQLFRNEGFSGFEVKPVAARFKTSSEAPPKLWELVLTGWAGQAAPASGIALDRSNSCPVCGHLRYTGLVHPDRLIDESQWDGSDFFMVWPLPMYVFVSDRVARTIHDNKLTGVRVERASDLTPTDGHSPGRLSYHMPEQRARELGEPLGIF